MEYVDNMYMIRVMCIGMGVPLMLIILKVVYSFWILPMGVHKRLKRNGFRGPPPSFPLGNILDMRKHKSNRIKPISDDDNHMNITHDIHSTVFPYFSKWNSSYGKVFIYWLGTEPFLYIADPEFLRKMSSGVIGKRWGKPSVFRDDRMPMFGNGGMVMVEGEDWVRHRHVISPAFSPHILKAMASSMVESATKMLDQWSNLIDSGEPEIDIEESITSTAAEIIANITFGINDDNGRKVFKKLRAMQFALFQSNRLVGVPFSRFMYKKETQEATRLGKEIDEILISIIRSRIINQNDNPSKNTQPQDLLEIFLSSKMTMNKDDLHDEKKDIESDNINGGGRKKCYDLTTSELVDECKTLFFGGHETTALTLSWTLLLLALNPEWQNHLRQEIKQVIGDGPISSIDPTIITQLKKMGWVMNEVLRLYSPAPNIQRQTREDIHVENLVIPNGTNMWIDVVGMNHDSTLWGDDVNQFKPERFKDDPILGGCKHKMGFLPFGFGGRMCVGRNLATMEYKIVLAHILTRFSLSLSPNYIHSPAIMLSLRPTKGLPLLLQHL